MISVSSISHDRRTASGWQESQEAPPERDKPRGLLSQWHLAAYVFQEAGPDAESVALWLECEKEGDYRQWERIKVLPRSRFIIDTSISAVQATSLRLREQVQGVIGRLLQRWRPKPGKTWLLPNGHQAEKVGERGPGREELQTDVLLVWSEGEGIWLDEAWLLRRWPESTRRQRLGENLYLVAGVQLTTPDPAPARECPHSTADRLLKAARDAQNGSRELDALADLGAAYLHEGRSDQAISVLEDALQLARKQGAGGGEREAGSRGRESDILANLGWMTIVRGQARRGLAILDDAREIAREVGDLFLEKTALERIGLAHVQLNQPIQALDAFSQALEIARSVKHRKHEAELLWSIAIQHAELGEREQAIHHAQSAIALMEEMHNPKATWFADLLQKYRSGERHVTLAEAATTNLDVHFSEVPTAALWASPDVLRMTEGPGLLRMAVSATKAMTRFIGSGFKTPPQAVVQYRLRTCAACEHHTGMRCRLCGCFTNAKAWLAHEECPIGRWPASHSSQSAD